MNFLLLQKRRSLSKNFDEPLVLVHNLKEMPLAVCATKIWFKNDQNSKIFYTNGL